MVLITLMLCKEIKHEENKVYRFSINQTINYNNLESNKIDLDILFHIYSKNEKINKGWILLFNFTSNERKYNKEIKNKEKNNLIIIEENYELYPNIINIDDFEEPNFSLNNFSYFNQNKKQSKKLKFINDFPLIKFIFSKNGILTIYKPKYYSDLDFYDLIQLLNRIIFTNKDKFFSKHVFDGEYDLNNNHTKNNEKEKPEEDKLFNFSIKNYIKELCKRNHFSLNIFKRQFLEIQLKGKINVFFLKNDIGIINFELSSKIFNNQKIKIISYNYTDESKEIKDILINKIGGLGEKLENYVNKLTYFCPKETIENIIKTIFKIIILLNIDNFFINPLKTLMNLFLNYKTLVLYYSGIIILFIINFINENFVLLKDFLEPIGQKIIESMVLLNTDFIRNLNLENFKEYFISTKNTIFNKVSETYSEIKNSEKTKQFFEKADKTFQYSKDKIKDISGEMIKNGIETIKDISKSETVKNIKLTCEEATNYIGNKLKGLFG